MSHASRSSTSSSSSRFVVAMTFALAVVAAVVGLGVTGATSNADWSVLAASGQAEWRDGPGRGSWQGLAANGSVPDGAEIRTGSDGSAVVAKGLDRIELRADTSLVVAARGALRGQMEIDQASGSATYTVEKRPAGTFAVRTPYVVAVVKGTKFDVDISNEETSVSVAEGRVGVSDQRGGRSVDVTPGQKATVGAGKSGVDVGRVSSNSKASEPATKNSSNSKANANSNSGGKGKDKDKDKDKDKGKGNGGGNDGGNDGSNGGGNGSGNGSGNGGGKDKGNGGGNGKGKGKDK